MARRAQVHERHLTGDFLLGVLRAVLAQARTRPTRHATYTALICKRPQTCNPSVQRSASPEAGPAQPRRVAGWARSAAGALTPATARAQRPALRVVLMSATINTQAWTHLPPLLSCPTVFPLRKRSGAR